MVWYNVIALKRKNAKIERERKDKRERQQWQPYTSDTSGTNCKHMTNVTQTQQNKHRKMTKVAQVTKTQLTKCRRRAIQRSFFTWLCHRRCRGRCCSQSQKRNSSLAPICRSQVLAGQTWRQQQNTALKFLGGAACAPKSVVENARRRVMPDCLLFRTFVHTD